MIKKKNDKEVKNIRLKISPFQSKWTKLEDDKFWLRLQEWHDVGR